VTPVWWIINAELAEPEENLLDLPIARVGGFTDPCGDEGDV
jgi:hypothetical protein